MNTMRLSMRLQQYRYNAMQQHTRS
jgi:hypothetical protein